MKSDLDYWIEFDRQRERALKIIATGEDYTRIKKGRQRRKNAKQDDKTKDIGEENG